MELYNNAYEVAKTLERKRMAHLETMREINSNADYTAEGKEKLIKKIIESYNSEVGNSNKEFNDLVTKYIIENTDNTNKIDLKALNEIIALINGLNIQLNDNELSEITENIKNNISTLEILRKELENRNYIIDEYEKTFYKLNCMNDKMEVFKKLEEFKKHYFKEDINLVCLKYSLEELRQIENKINTL